MTSEDIGRLQKAAAMSDVAIISQVMVDILIKNPHLTFYNLEEQLRGLNSDTYLVAIPRQFLPGAFEASLVLDGTPAKFYLWVCLHGEKEQGDLLRAYSMTQADNLLALRHCGVMTISSIRKTN